jgi:hypothetical protein
MSLHPHDGTAAEALAASLLQLVGSERQLGLLRQDLSGFSHRCRNLLNGVKMGLYFVRRKAARPLPPWWDDVERHYQGIEGLFDQLQTIYRPISLTLICAPFGSLVQDRQQIWSDWLASRGGSLHTLSPHREAAGEFDPMYLSMALDSLVRLRAAVAPAGQIFQLSWRSCKLGFQVAWREPAVNAGSSGFAPATTDDSTSGCCADLPKLALPLLARVLTAHQGTMKWSREPEFRVEFAWPLVHSQNAEAPST